jgi:hypothetical protein
MAKKESPEQALARFMARYDPAIVTLAERALAMLQKRLPGAMRLVYDNYNALVIAFGPSERASEIVCSIALYPRWVTLFFLRGATLPDPKKLLRGTGKTIRSIQLDTAELLEAPDVRALLSHAAAPYPSVLDPDHPAGVSIRSVVAKQRPRRPPAKKATKKQKV